MRALAAVAIGIAVLGSGCGRSEPTASSDAAPTVSEAAFQQAEQRARAAAGDLMGSLLPELQGALQAGGPVKAVDICADRAQKLTSEVQTRHEGLRIRRTSLRVRNPVNAPDEFERAWLEAVGAGQSTPEPTTTRGMDEQGRDEVRYLQPLVMAELCLQCHGPADGIDPAVRSILAERYPEDQATGFAVGDLRGMISVRVPVE